MLKKLRVKFICINMLIVTVMLSAIFVFAYQSTRQSLEKESLQMLRSVAMDPFQPGRPNERPGQIRLPYFLLEERPQGEFVAIGDSYFDLTDETFLKEIADAVSASKEQTGVLRGYSLRFYRSEMPMGRRIVFADISSEQHTLSSLLQNCALIGIASFLAFFIISLLLARWVVRPVDQAWQEQRQFVADASHELKTPLTVILTNAELLQEPEYDEQARAQFAQSILAMSRQMRGLVESLLELARADSGTVKTALTKVDFSRVVADAVLPFEPLFFERGLDICCQIEEGIGLNGSETHLRQIVEILLDNAMKYSSPEGAVDVRLKRQGTHCVLSVANPGEPISKEDQKNIFKRFYRLDKARSMNHSYGLGLSIAESIVKLHRGKIWVQSSGGVNTFFAELPIG